VFFNKTECTFFLNTLFMNLFFTMPQLLLLLTFRFFNDYDTVKAHMKMKKATITTITLFGIILLGLIGTFATRIYDSSTSDTSVPPQITSTNSEQSPEMQNTNALMQNQEIQPTPSKKTPEPSPLPISVIHDIPFTSQAPYGNWEQPYQDACEEASLLMYHAALTNMTLSTKTADKEILRLVDYEESIGYSHDVNDEQLVRVAKDVYAYENLTIDEVDSVEELKQYLADNNVIIAPLAGQMLGNPYYTPPGPDYHMLVIIGYDEKTKEFITNDPGTKHGEGYRYSYITLFNSIHAWTGSKATIRQGSRSVIIAPMPQ